VTFKICQNPFSDHDARGHPSPYPTPLDTDQHSALAMRPPEFQPDLRLTRFRERSGRMIPLNGVDNMVIDVGRPFTLQCKTISRLWYVV